VTKAQTGVTLVELLLAVTLLSILLALAYGGLHAATRATDRGQVILEESGRLRMAHQFVRKQLNQAIPMSFSQKEGETADVKTSEVFLGSAGSIRFVGPMPGYLGFGGPQVQQLSIVGAEEGLQLVLEHASVQGFDETRLTERDPILLIDHIASARFGFLTRDEAGEILPWTELWDDPALMPLAVSLEIEFEEGTYMDWPLLVAAIRIDPSVMEGVSSGQEYESAIKGLIDKRDQRN